MYSFVLLTFAFCHVIKTKRKTKGCLFNSFNLPEWISADSPEYSKFILWFSFTNQNGEIVNQKTVDGKIYVANFIFTSCGSICPKMTNDEDFAR
jgi:cytochrome oxidase Cu insertion factor (SCO1/SenC/PrrC family)